MTVIFKWCWCPVYSHTCKIIVSARFDELVSVQAISQGLGLTVQQMKTADNPCRQWLGHHFCIVEYGYSKFSDSVCSRSCCRMMTLSRSLILLNHWESDHDKATDASCGLLSVLYGGSVNGQQLVNSSRDQNACHLQKMLSSVCFVRSIASECQWHWLTSLM